MKPEIFNQFTHNGLIHAQVSFIPDVTIECSPPYIKGKRDSCWISYPPGNKPRIKKEFEERIGMKIQWSNNN